MTKETYWRDADGLAHFKLRRLETLCPLLKEYLHPGMEVLDVGCGPGPITLDVAHEIFPGTVIGVDQDNHFIDEGRRLGEIGQATNALFNIGDTYNLDFVDNSFDLTYSLNLLPWLTDPVSALSEQRRVTKSGGWVVANVLDWDTALTYPPCPRFNSFLMALRHLADPQDSELYVSYFLGQQCVGLFRQAGFTELRVTGYGAPAFCVYQGAEYFEDRYKQYQDHLQLEGAFAPRLHKMIDLGILTPETLLAAQEELRIWREDPYAFHIVTAIVIAGRVGKSI